MVNVKTRKAVYIPNELWSKLDAEARPKFDSVTTVLKNILLEHFNVDNKKIPFQKIPIVEDDDSDF